MGATSKNTGALPAPLLSNGPSPQIEGGRFDPSVWMNESYAPYGQPIDDTLLNPTVNVLPPQLAPRIDQGIQNLYNQSQQPEIMQIFPVAPVDQGDKDGIPQIPFIPGTTAPADGNGGISTPPPPLVIGGGPTFGIDVYGNSNQTVTPPNVIPQPPAITTPPPNGEVATPSVIPQPPIITAPPPVERPPVEPPFPPIEPSIVPTPTPGTQPPPVPRPPTPDTLSTTPPTGGVIPPPASDQNLTYPDIYDIGPFNFDYNVGGGYDQPYYPMPQSNINDFTNMLSGGVSPQAFMQSYGAGYGMVPNAPELSAYGMFQGGVNAPNLQYGIGQAGQISNAPTAGQYGFAGAGNLQNPQLASQFDLSNVAQMPINAGTTGQQAILSRVAPALQAQRSQLETKLINQGLRPGDEAWNAAMAAQGQQENDAITQAALQGINLDIAANQQGFGQAQAQAQFANQAALAGFGAGLQRAQFGNQAIGQNFSQALQAQQAQNAAQQQQFSQLAQAGQFGNEAQLAAFQAALQNQQAYNQGVGLNQQAALQQAQMAADLQNQGFSQAQALQAARNAAMQQNFANMQTYQQSQNQAAAQAFQQQLAAAQYANAAQQQAYQQAAMIRQMPINEITALMSGSQIANPAFQAYQGAVAQPGDIQAATAQQAAWNQNIYNQKVASRNALMGGLFGLGSAGLTGGLSLLK